MGWVRARRVLRNPLLLSSAFWLACPGAGLGLLCGFQALAAAPSCLEGLYSSLIRERAGESGYEVLLPRDAESFELGIASTEAEARERVRERLDDVGAEPLDVHALIAGGDATLEDMLPALRAVEGSEKGVLLVKRLKSPGSLRDKIFRKVGERGRAFRLGELDDVAAARFVVESPRQIDLVAGRLEHYMGFKIVKDERKAKAGGYRGRHLTLEDAKGRVMEVQIMTVRTSRWSAWNHGRVYKPGEPGKAGPLDESYFSRLREYDLQIARYLNSLDDGGPRPFPPRPDPSRLEIRPEDVFPEDWLN